MAISDGRKAGGGHEKKENCFQMSISQIWNLTMKWQLTGREEVKIRSEGQGKYQRGLFVEFLEKQARTPPTPHSAVKDLQGDLADYGGV